ncbi:MAG: hypothetical protein V7L11_14820 [Nostoc sp.]
MFKVNALQRSVNLQAHKGGLRLRYYVVVNDEERSPPQEKISYDKSYNYLHKHVILITYTAKYTKTNSGYMGQLIEWQEVITEAETIYRKV